MASEKRTQELIRGLQEAVLGFDEEAAVELSKAALDEGVEPYDAIVQGLAVGMDKAGELYEKKEYFVPELLLCSDTLYAGLAILQSHVKLAETKSKGQVVIGVVEGDIHDIGKNLVKVMFIAAGWTVHDLGRDVELSRFTEEQARTGSDIVAISALTTTTMLAMQAAVKLIKTRTPRIPVMVGGAPLSREIATLYGADGYAPNAVGAVLEADRLLKKA
jgi:methanogenic corrinoid protein MtbC1